MTLKEKQEKVDIIVGLRDAAEEKMDELKYLINLLRKHGFEVGEEVTDAYCDALNAYTRLTVDLELAIDEWCDEDYDIDEY